MWCWGANRFGQLGDGSVVQRLSPVKVVGIDDALSLGAGPGTACAIRQDGTVWCWGYRVNGILGDGDGTRRLTSPQYSALPVQVPDVVGAVQVDVGNESACALTRDGSVYCWGDGGWGIHGDAVKGTVGYPLAPSRVKNLDSAVAVAVAGWSACAILTDHTVECWGSAWPIGMGIGVLDDQMTPRPPTPATGPTGITEITAAGQRTCVLNSNHEVWCWGRDLAKRFSNDPTSLFLAPTRVEPPAGAKGVVTADDATCVLKMESGAAECWGDRSDYQLGDGRWWTLSSSGPLVPRYPPVTVLTGRDESQTPAVEFPLEGIEQVAMSSFHSCATQTSGVMYCWGANSSGQLGDGRPGWFDVSFKFAIAVASLPKVLRPRPAVIAPPSDCHSTTDRDCDGVVEVAVLGDSYISGEGANQRSRYLGCTNAYLFDCDRNSDNQLTDADRLDSVQLKKFESFAGQTGFSGNNCHRSSGSWGWQVAESLATAPALQNVLFAACSGAESKHVDTEAQYPDSPAFLAGGDSQVGHLRSFGSADVVFVSLGGNDFGFGDVVASCYPLPLARCGGSDDERTRRLQQVSGRRANLVEALAAVKAAAPQATVYVSNYPLVVSSQSSCPGSGDLSWVRTEYLPAVNAAVAQASLQAGVRTIDLTDTNDQADVQLGNLFAGHEVCIPDLASSWVNGLSRGEELTFGMVGSESFHPTVVGHDAIRDAVRSQLVDSGRLGVLSNPAPVNQGIPPANGLPREVATFEIAPTGLQQDAFHGSVTGAPSDTDLTIRLHSEPLDLARVRTDADGEWQGVVGLPTWASSGVHELEVLESASGATFWRGVAFLGQPPQPQPDSTTTDKGQSVLIDVLANDSDPDTAVAQLRLVSAKAVHGSVQIVDGGLLYTPADDFVGEDSGTYEVCDVAEPCAQGAFTVDVLPAQMTGLQVSFEATGRRPWSGAGTVDTSELQVVRNPDGKLASVRGAVSVPGPAGESYRVRLDVSNVLFWSFGSVTATDLRTGKEVTTFRLFADPLAETEQRGTRSLVVTGTGLQFYRGSAYPSSLTVTLTGSV